MFTLINVQNSSSTTEIKLSVRGIPIIRNRGAAQLGGERGNGKHSAFETRRDERGIGEGKWPSRESGVGTRDWRENAEFYIERATGREVVKLQQTGERYVKGGE